MPYALPSGSGPTSTGVELRVDTPRLFTLMTPFWYRPYRPLPNGLDADLPQSAGAPDGMPGWVLIPSSSTDLGSVPGVLWGLIASYGRHTLAVLVHDHLSDRADQAPAQDRFRSRSVADEVFHQALRDPEAGQYRAPWWRSLVLWSGVSVARYWQDNRPGFVALCAASVGGWLASWWLAQNVGGRAAPVASWILAIMGVVVLAFAGAFAARLSGLRPQSLAVDPLHTPPPPTKLQQAAQYVPPGGGTIGRASDVWVVRALAGAAAALLVAAAWSALPVPLLFGVGVPGFVAVVGLVAFVAGSAYLALSPIRRDALLPLVAVIAGPPVGLVAGVTVAVLYLMWLPDAFAGNDEGPINTVGRRRRDPES